MSREAKTRILTERGVRDSSSTSSLVGVTLSERSKQGAGLRSRLGILKLAAAGNVCNYTLPS